MVNGLILSPVMQLFIGCEVEHWREPFDGDYHIQAFLHFVNKHGPYAHHEGDRNRGQC